jgi:hypothetical protein
MAATVNNVVVAERGVSFAFDPAQTNTEDTVQAGEFGLLPVFDPAAGGDPPAGPGGSLAHINLLLLGVG